MMMNRHTLQQQPVAAADLAEPVSMKEWTGGAIDSLSSKSNESKHPSKDEIVCSHAYMSCALKIAHSLADQLSTVEEERRDLLLQDSYGNNNSPLLVDNNKSWSEYISVYCMKRSIDEKNGEISVNNNGGDNVEGASIDIDIDADIQPLPFNFYGGGGDNSEQPEELQNLEHRLSTLFDINNVNQSIDYLNVRGAIVNEEAAADGKLFHIANGTLEIRPLGIAFYELFSGEQITTTAEAGVPQPSYPPQSPSVHNVGQTAPEFHERSGGSELIKTIGGPSKRMCQSNISLGKSSQKTISVEPLKLLGLPTSLCELISNMIESGNGNTHGGIGEAYEFISEVRDDLKLMIDSPNIYLEDIDLAKATNVGLQFGSSLHGREAEMQALKESCQRSISTGCEVAMICGTSGIGKSKLSEEFARSAKESGSIFISGRCDKLQSQPLKPISSAFNKYCAWLSVNDRSTAEKIATALKEYLGEDLASLVSAMPNLANILGDDFVFTENENDAAMDSQKRLRYLFCVFTGVISSCHDTPLIFFLDDCQWMDSATVALLNQIMIMTGVDIEDNGFFFGCYRDDEMGETHPLFQMLSTVNSLCGTKTTKIHLTPMSKGDLNEMVSTTLNLLPRITRPLADMLHHRTKGSPLFVKQVMMDLYKQRLLYPSLSRRRWVWEFDKILEMKIPENVAAFITKSFDRLPSEVLSALVVLSCFGASADISLIEVLEREIQQPLIAPLDVAVAHSVLGKRNGEFYFMHDKLQEAAYSMMKPEERCLHHNRYGLALGFVAEREKDDKMLLTAVGQINHGGSQVVIDDEQAIVVANLNLDAGMKAMIMSDFFLAHSFFNHGISFLRRGHWTEHYDLSLQLFNLAAKCALLNAEHESVQALIDKIMHNAKCFEDKSQAISNTITLLTWSGNVLGAIELVNSTLSSLGEGLPAKITSSVIKQNLDNTKAQLASLSDDTLLSYPAMVNNPSKILALELFTTHFQILPLVHQTAVMPLIPLKIIQVSLAYGMSPRSPIGFAQYGNFLALVRDEFEEGYRYVKFALSLMKKIPSRAYAGSVMFHANYTKVHVEPMQSVIECYLDAYFASMKSGNPYAIGCSYVYNTFCFWSGKELKAVVSSMKETLMESKYQKNLLVRALMLPTIRMVLRLMGQSGAPQQDHDINTSAEARNEDDIKQVLHLRAVFFVRLSEALIFRELVEARDAAKEYFSIGEVGCKFAVTTIPLFFMRLYSGLVSFWIGREINDKKSESMKWLARGVACKDEIEKLAASASKWNFQNKVYLLQAEEQFCRMNFEEAEKLYDAAILTSKAHKFLNEEALANELAGHFYLETGRRDRSVHYFSQAFEKYNEWGAAAKANMLTKYLDGR